jgi:hypothetical protein
MLVACFRALLGAALMFGPAGADLRLCGEARLWTEKGSDACRDGATDGSLFGVVLIIFAYAIAFGCVFRLALRGAREGPEVDAIRERQRIQARAA